MHHNGFKEQEILSDDELEELCNFGTFLGAKANTVAALRKRYENDMARHLHFKNHPPLKEPSGEKRRKLEYQDRLPSRGPHGEIVKLMMLKIIPRIWSGLAGIANSSMRSRTMLLCKDGIKLREHWVVGLKFGGTKGGTSLSNWEWNGTFCCGILITLSAESM